MNQRILRGVMLGALASGLFAWGAEAQSQSLMAGSYRCASYNVSGGGGSCRNMQPLQLHADQSYQFGSTQGRWRAQGGTLVLSESSLWGPGQILGRDSVRFDYEYRGWHHTVTWVCQACATAAADSQAVDAPTAASTAAATKATAAAPAQPGGYRGVPLTLEFAGSMGGVSGYTIVPAESARGYTHNAPLPEGAVQGLAREVGARSVALATNASNKLRSGRQYVVFLAWPRETLPVASFSLPPGNTDYSAALAAALP